MMHNPGINEWISCTPQGDAEDPTHEHEDWPLHDILVTNSVWCMAYKRGVWGGRILPNSRAIVLQQCGQCRRARRMKGGSIRAQTARSLKISCGGQYED